MTITKQGDPAKMHRGEFSFRCKNCGCEWNADRGKDGAHISPPFVEFFAYMDCPNCGSWTKDR